LTGLPRHEKMQEPPLRKFISFNAQHCFQLAGLYFQTTVKVLSEAILMHKLTVFIQNQCINGLNCGYM